MDERFNHMNIDDFVIVDDDNPGTTKYVCLNFVDAMKMAQRAWSDGASFDTDIRIIKDAVVSTPIRIVHKEPVVINRKKMYCLWGLVEVNSVDYAVAIRFYAHRDEFDKNCFDWLIEQPVNKISLVAIVELLEHQEDKKWSDLLDG